LKNIKKLMSLFFKKKTQTTPLLILKKEADDVNVREYKSIEEAIAGLENDLNVPKDKIEKLRSSLRNLKNNSLIKIKNREIIK